MGVPSTARGSTHSQGIVSRGQTLREAHPLSHRQITRGNLPTELPNPAWSRCGLSVPTLASLRSLPHGVTYLPRELGGRCRPSKGSGGGGRSAERVCDDAPNRLLGKPSRRRRRSEHPANLAQEVADDVDVMRVA
jgi:hypothetical protein